MYQLRPAFCSHVLMQGIDPRTRHKDRRTTLRYAHVSADQERAAIQRLSFQDGHHMDTTAQNN
ncbi:MAG: hypothetical protein GKR89_36635 [Candidatus Latescibacteria bacterium]|nr:hypothetical protein [Candidatus Latescibacterota bacterium]